MAHKNAKGYEIIDIGGGKLHDFFLESLRKTFLESRGAKEPYVSDIFTSSDQGMEMWSTLTSLPTSYQTREEIDLLQCWGPDIAKHIRPGSHLLDLGSGDVKKISPLLDQIEALQCSVTYYSVDLSRASIAFGLEKLSQRYKYVTLVGLWGTFDDAKTYLEHIDSPRVLASLGAQIGNDSFEAAFQDLASWMCKMRSTDQILLGIDGTQDKKKIWKHYHSREFHQFIRTGMVYTNTIIGYEWFRDQDWALDGEFREEPRAHSFVFTAMRDVSCPDAGISFRQGNQFKCYESHRTTPEETRKLFRACGLKETGFWQSSDSGMYDFLLSLGE